jgi:protein-ribulosamine 3-kinase
MNAIDRAISESTDSLFRLDTSASMAGGCINEAFFIKGKDGRQFFVKKNQAPFLSFFKAEAQALTEIGETQTIHVPEVIAHGVDNDKAFLVLEFMKEGTTSTSGQAKLGTLLAKMHRVEQTHFGWGMDNCIGATPQPNPKSDNWAEFYKNHRLSHQFNLAAQKGRHFEGANDLLDQIDSFFATYQPHPSLLHGDLWGGNASYDSTGMPFVFDPASYYGDRETDLAFTYMFGGFTSAFYQAYEQEYPLESGFKIRKTLYNLYHELNHFNLFGGGYASSAQSSINELLRQA